MPGKTADGQERPSHGRPGSSLTTIIPSADDSFETYRDKRDFGATPEPTEVATLRLGRGGDHGGGRIEAITAGKR